MDKPRFITNWIRSKTKYADGLHIGAPRETARYSSQQLRSMGIIGIYADHGTYPDFRKLTGFPKATGRRSVR